MSFTDLNIRIKDVISYGIYLITFTVFVVTINNKVDYVVKTVEEIKEEKKAVSSDYKTLHQQMQNQINANSLQIQLMKQDIEMIKQGYYLNTKK